MNTFDIHRIWDIDIKNGPLGQCPAQRFSDLSDFKISHELTTSVLKEIK